MKMKMNGREGSLPYQPKGKTLGAIAGNDATIAKHRKPDASAAAAGAKDLRAQIQAFAASQLKLTKAQRALVVSLDEDELRGLTCELAGEMGIPKLPAARLVAKVQGLGLRPSGTGAGAAAQPIASLPQEAWAQQPQLERTARLLIDGDGALRREALRPLVLAMLRRDDELRLSAEVQALYRKKPESGRHKTRVTVNLQRSLVAEFGFATAPEVGVDLLRSATCLFGGDAEVMAAAHYLRHNIVRDCPFSAGDALPAVPLHLHDSEGSTDLHSLLRNDAGLPTVLLAGSHTWPPFRSDVPALLEFKAAHERRHGACFKYAVVYIAEAHASDTWPMGWAVEWETPKSLGARKKYAATCARDLAIPLVPGSTNAFELFVDGMDDAFNRALAPWPTCYYVISAGARLLYVGESAVDSASYDVGELFRFMRRWSQQQRGRAAAVQAAGRARTS